MITTSGLVIPVLKASSFLAGRREDLLPLLKNRAIHSVMGRASDVRVVERVLTNGSQAALDYFSMISCSGDLGSDQQGAEPAIRGVHVHRARTKDTFQLYPLQRAYEKEEVLLDPKRFNPSGCYLSLQKTIKEQIVYYATVGKSPAAKVGTNARGFDYAQIGGVYTAEEYRNKGIAFHLMLVLMHHLSRAGRVPCLFVKKDNQAALRLYRKMAFSRTDDFRIVYYRE